MSSNKGNVLPTPRRLLNLDFTWMYRLFEAFHASSEEAEIFFRGIGMIFRYFKEKLRHIKSSYTASKQIIESRCLHFIPGI